jgi:predicted nuclease of predicted toxin-antitoxin system
VRFVLDHDVPARCRRVLIKAGHDAWTVGQAGRATASDDQQTSYAHDQHAALISIDREFASRRVSNPIGRHVRLAVAHTDAVAVLEEYLDEIVALLHKADVTVVVTKTSIKAFRDWR